MKLFSLFIFVGVSACSGPSVTDLESLKESSAPLSKKVPEVLEPIDEKSPEAVVTPSPGYDRVMSLLAGLGYQGIGLEHEEKETLEFLEQVFLSSQSQDREIERVYTGLKLSYDAEQKSLTLGEDRSLTKTLQFIQKTIPKRR